LDRISLPVHLHTKHKKKEEILMKQQPTSGKPSAQQGYPLEHQAFQNPTQAMAMQPPAQLAYEQQQPEDQPFAGDHTKKKKKL
jgi:hypothetical protein